MDYGEAFTYMFRGKDWIAKILLGVVLALFLPLGGIGAIPLIGWSIAIGRGVIRGQDDPLPEWSELGQIIVDGLKATVIFIVWNLPAIIIAGAASLVDNGAVQAICGLCGFLYTLVVAFLSLGVYGLLADDRPFGAAINPVNAWQVVSANWANTIIAWILAMVGILAATTIGVILCVVGVVLGWAYGFALGGHLYGQLYRQATMGGKVAA